MYPLKAAVGGLDQLEHTLCRQPGGMVCAGTHLSRTGLVRGFAAEGKTLQIGKARGPLNVSKGIRIYGDPTGELLPRGKHPAKLPRQLLGVLAHDAEQIDDIAVEIIDDFALWTRGAPENHASHSDEWLGVALVGNRLDSLDDPLGQVFLAAEPGSQGLGCPGCFRLSHGCHTRRIKSECKGRRNDSSRKSDIG